jgi:GxxExxY protein
VDAVAVEEPVENKIGTAIIASAMTVHSALGPGLLEHTYELCLAYELSKRALCARKQVSLPLHYGDLLIEDAYRMDLLVDCLVVVEVKAIETILPVHRGQLLSYLRLGGYRLGYLLNFNVAHMRDGIIRRANGLISTAATAKPPRPLR